MSDSYKIELRHSAGLGVVMLTLTKEILLVRKRFAMGMTLVVQEQ